MTEVASRTFSETISGLTKGQTISYACKFAFAGGLAVTRYIDYVVGQDCEGDDTDDDDADADNDGVDDAFDICPNTPSGASVNTDGCSESQLDSDGDNPVIGSITGTWKIEPIAGALGVGPTQGDITWWSNSEADVAY